MRVTMGAYMKRMAKIYFVLFFHQNTTIYSHFIYCTVKHTDRNKYKRRATEKSHFPISVASYETGPSTFDERIYSTA